MAILQTKHIQLELLQIYYCRTDVSKFCFFKFTIFTPNKLDLDICKLKTVLCFRNLRNVYLFIDFKGMKAQVKRALKAILFFFSETKN